MKLTNQKILEIAMQQSAYDSNCQPEDFRKKSNVVVTSCKNENARKYLELPFACNLVSYGTNIVASAEKKFCGFVENYINKYAVEHCFETPNLHVLNDELQKYGVRICFMAEYFLPDLSLLKQQPCKYEIRILQQPDFKELYVPEWSNALCRDRKQLDVLGAGAYEEGRLIGLAACSADCEKMWQIGIDVLPDYRQKGVAAALTSRLAFEILDRGKVPFYCAAWFNIKSVRNAIKSGFRPAWVEMTAKREEFVEKLNQ